MKEVYTLADLRAPEEDPQNIFSREERPAKLAVIGDPIAHSKSPQLHQPALDALGINATYIRVHLTAEEFDEGLQHMKELGFIGCNVTVPHKEKALAWTSRKDPLAAQVGVANTILFAKDICYTTDPFGLKSAVKEAFDYPLERSRIFISGAGGGAGSAVAQYIAQHEISHLFLYNRTPEKLDNTYEKIIHSCSVDMTKVSCNGGGEYPAKEELELLINATSLGLKEEDPSPIPEEQILPNHLVYDMTYGCHNALRKICEAKGARYADGLSMLRHQGAEAFKLWFPKETEGVDLSTLMGL